MTRVLIIGILVLLLLQLAAGQTTACQNALNTLAANIACCTATAENRLIICTRQCGEYYDDVIENRDQAVSQVVI